MWCSAEVVVVFLALQLFPTILLTFVGNSRSLREGKDMRRKLAHPYTSTVCCASIVCVRKKDYYCKKE